MANRHDHAACIAKFRAYFESHEPEGVRLAKFSDAFDEAVNALCDKCFGDLHKIQRRQHSVGGRNRRETRRFVQLTEIAEEAVDIDIA